MRAPAFLLYASDWLGSADLRRLDHRLKGVFIDLLCLAHGSDEHGLLRWPLAEIARAIGCRPADLRALAEAGVLRGDEKSLAVAYTYTPRSGRREGPTVTLVAAQPGPIWFIGRMVRDAHVRRQRGEGSRFVTPAAPPEPSPKSSSKPPSKAGFGDPEGDGYPSQAISNEEAVALRDEGEVSGTAAAHTSPPELPVDWREAAVVARDSAGLQPLDVEGMAKAWASFQDPALNPSPYARESRSRWVEWAKRERRPKTGRDDTGDARDAEAAAKQDADRTQEWKAAHAPLTPEEKARADEARIVVMKKHGRPLISRAEQGRA